MFKLKNIRVRFPGVSATFERDQDDFDQEVGASGFNCFLPILRANKAVQAMRSGKILRVIATDPGSVKDFQAFSEQTGHELLDSLQESGKYVFCLKKS